MQQMHLDTAKEIKQMLREDFAFVYGPQCMFSSLPYTTLEPLYSMENQPSPDFDTGPLSDIPSDSCTFTCEIVLPFPHNLLFRMLILASFLHQEEVC